MISKEKKKEIYNRMLDATSRKRIINHGGGVSTIRTIYDQEVAKECTMICIEEIKKSHNQMFDGSIEGKYIKKEKKTKRCVSCGCEILGDYIGNTCYGCDP